MEKRKMLVMRSWIYFACLLAFFAAVSAVHGKTVDSLRLELNRTSDPASRIQLLHSIATEYQNKYPDSVLIYARHIEAIDLKSGLKDYFFHNLMYAYYRQTGETDRFLYHAQRSYQFAIQLNDGEKISDGLNNIAIAFMINGALDSAVSYFQHALEHAVQLSDEVREKRILVNYANILVKTGELSQAREIAVKGISIDSLLNDRHALAVSYKLLGNIGFYESKYDEAAEAYQKSLDLFEAVSDTLNIISVNNNLAVVYESLKDYENAVRLQLINLELIERTGVESSKISVLINLGNIYDYQGKKNERVKMLNEALTIAVKYNDYKYIASIYNNLGNGSYYNGEYVQALDYFENALKVNVQTGDKQEETRCRANIGWANLKLGNDQKALESFSQSLLLAKEIGSNEKRMLALDGISSVYSKLGNFKKALEYKEMVFALNDSILGEKTRKTVAELQTKYETEKKVREIEKLKQIEQANKLDLAENELTINRLYLQRTMFVLMVVLIILITSSIIWWIRIKKEKEKTLAVNMERETGLIAVFEATEDERKRIAKDLHDSVGQQLSALKLSWQHYNISMQTSPSTDQERIESMTRILNDVITEVREISHQMMPRILQESGIVPAIEDMLDKVFRNSPVSFTFEHFGIDSRMSEKTEIGLYRICQELVSNIIKHASATQVHVQLFKNNTMLVLLVEDNGLGIDKTGSSNGIGLLNISSRAETIHGEFNLEPSPVSGTLATIRIPINNL
jgi:signal transduction histidine kinase